MVSKLFAAACCAAALSLTPAAAVAGPSDAPAVTLDDLSTDQIRALALQALSAGKPGLALALARRVLAEDPADRAALMVVTVAAPAAGDPAAGMRAGAQAFRLSSTRGERFAASRLTARAAYEAGAYTRAQLWLRRATFYARTTAEKKLTAYDYRTVRAKNPLQIDLQFSFSNSDNVNGGANSRFNEIDGIPVVGILSPSAQALSGSVGWARARLGYTLSESPKQRTTVNANLFLREVRLSREARAAAPDVDNGDFSAQSLELGVERRWLLPGGKTELSLDGALGRQFYGGEKSSDYVRVGLGARQRLGDDSLLDFGADVEQRQIGATGDIGETESRLTLGHIGKLGPGQLELRLAGTLTRSDRANDAGYGAEAQARYSLGKPVGPLRFAFGVGAAYARFPDYTMLIFAVPGGREDRTVFGSIEVSPEGYGVAGFVPVLALTASQTDSNVGRFSREQLSLQIGFRSAF